MNKIASIIIILALAGALGLVFWGGKSEVPAENNVEVRDGVQYVAIDAKGGYFPKVSSAKAGIPTKLVMNTRGTYDCSSALVIKSISYQNILPQNGSTEIDIGTGKAGETIQGLCSMGMYNFTVKFN